jgi:peptide/nickel transport system permease protein
VTLSADLLPAMLGGSVLVEVLFGIPGMGRLSWDAIEQKDYPTLMALVYVDAILVLFGILLADLLYYVVDPRISLKSGAEIE